MLKPWQVEAVRKQIRVLATKAAKKTNGAA